jgi:hypothetical protein
MKLMSIDEYLSIRYTEGSRPCRATIIRRIQQGMLPGKKQGHRYYVNLTAEERSTGDPDVDLLVNKVLDG